LTIIVLKLHFVVEIVKLLHISHFTDSML